MASGPRQHFIPAALIGEFSRVLKGPGRERSVYVRRRGDGQAKAVRADDVGWRKNYYADSHPMSGWSAETADGAWSIYESNLISALHELRDNPTISAQTYIWTLVPFASAVFTRGLDEELQAEQLRQTVGNRVMINSGRMLNYQRGLGVVASAKWMVYHRRSDLPLILNDRGFVVVRLGQPNDPPAYYIPLSCDSALVLIAGDHAPRVDMESARVQGIVHKDLPAPAVAFNALIAKAAVTEIYGPSAEVLETIEGFEAWPSGESAAPIGGGFLVRAGVSPRRLEGLWRGMVGDLAARHGRLPRVRGMPLFVAINEPMDAGSMAMQAQLSLKAAERGLARGGDVDALHDLGHAEGLVPGITRSWLTRMARHWGASVESSQEQSGSKLQRTPMLVSGTTLQRALLHLATNQFTEAAVEFTALLTAQAGVGATAMELDIGRLMAANSDPQGALIFLHRASASTDPEIALKAHWQLGLVNRQIGDVDAAIRAYGAALDGGTSNLSALAGLNKAELLRAIPDVGQAVVTYRRVIDIADSGASPKAAFNLGTLLFENGDEPGALAAWQQALAFGDREASPLAAVNAAALLLKNGDDAGACAAFQRAIDSNHPDAAPYAAVQLGLIHATANRPDQAAAAFRMAAESGHPHWAAVAAQQIGNLPNPNAPESKTDL